MVQSFIIQCHYLELKDVNKMNVIEMSGSTDRLQLLMRRMIMSSAYGIGGLVRSTVYDYTMQHIIFKSSIYIYIYLIDIVHCVN